MVEVPRHKRNVDVPGFADRLTVVETLEHGEEPALFLEVPGDRVKVTSPAVAA